MWQPNSVGSSTNHTCRPYRRHGQEQKPTGTGKPGFPSKNKPDPNSVEVAVGETAELKDRTIVFNEVERGYLSPSRSAMKPQDGNEYLRTYITLKNTSNQSFDYNAGKFQVQDSSGVQHRGRTLSELPYRIEFGELAPGGTVEGNLIFEIPEGDSGITLIYEPFEEDVGTVTVSL